MARILFSGVAGVDMRGKLNGSVFSKNRSGAYVRTKVTPVNPQTTSQQNARNRLASNSQAWRGLAEEQREGWNNVAPSFPYTDIYGNSKILSGFQLYVKLNSNLSLIGSSNIAEPPSPVAIPAMTNLAIAADAGGPSMSLTFAPTPVPAGFRIVVMATPSVTPGKTFVKNLFRVVVILNAAEASPFNLEADYEAIFGFAIGDNKLFVKTFYVSTDTGQAGIPLQAQTIITP